MTSAPRSAGDRPERDAAGVLDRDAPDPDLVVRYGDGADHLVDVHLPPGPVQRSPVIVLLHGGFWRREFDRTHVRPLADALRLHGWVVATPEYARTARGVTGWPRTFDDVDAVRRRLPGLLRDAVPGRIADGPFTVVGHSAGGHLALWWALTAPPGGAPRRVVALAPVADLARAYADDLGDGAVRDLLGGGPQDHPDRFAAADPAPRLARYDIARIGVPVKRAWRGVDAGKAEEGAAVDTAATDENAAGSAPRRASQATPCPRDVYVGPATLTVLHGVEDDRVPIGHSRALPHVHLHELAGTGHFELIDPLSAAWPHVLHAVTASDPTAPHPTAPDR